MGFLRNLIFGESLPDKSDWRERREKEFRESEERMAWRLFNAIEEHNKKNADPQKLHEIEVRKREYEKLRAERKENG